MTAVRPSALVGDPTQMEFVWSGHYFEALQSGVGDLSSVGARIARKTIDSV